MCFRENLKEFFTKQRLYICLERVFFLNSYVKSYINERQVLKEIGVWSILSTLVLYNHLQLGRKMYNVSLTNININVKNKSNNNSVKNK